MLSLYRRGRIWWARGRVRGQVIQRSLDTRNKDVAWQRCVDLELRGGKRDANWSDFRLEFLRWTKPHIAQSTDRKYQFTIERLGRFLNRRGIAKVHDVTPEVIAAYREDRRRDVHPNKGGTVGDEGIKSDMRILHRVFSYAAECGYIDKNPVISPKLHTVAGKTMPFTREEVVRMLGTPYLDHRRRAMLMTFLYTGLRISDVSGLLKRNVDFERGSILLRTQKRKTDVFLGLHPELKHALKEHMRQLNDAQRFSQFMFPTKTGRRNWPQSMDAQLRRIFISCGIEKGHAHRFRDHFAVRLLENGATLYDVSKMLGITIRVAEMHYSPYVSELRERGKRLVENLDFSSLPVYADCTNSRPK